MIKAKNCLAFLSWSMMFYGTALPLSAGIPGALEVLVTCPGFHLWSRKRRLAGLLTPQMAEVELWRTGWRVCGVLREDKDIDLALFC